MIYSRKIFSPAVSLTSLYSGRDRCCCGLHALGSRGLGQRSICATSAHSSDVIDALKMCDVRGEEKDGANVRLRTKTEAQSDSAKNSNNRNSPQKVTRSNYKKFPLYWRDEKKDFCHSFWFVWWNILHFTRGWHFIAKVNTSEE